MATGVDQQEYVDDFEQFFREYYRDAVGELARNYPSEQKSLYVDWEDLYRFDRELAEGYLEQPEQYQRCAEEALRLYDLPVDVSLGQAHVRIRNLPETTEIRSIRSTHVNTLVAVRGIVRKATDVRPKCVEAAFRCVRCETLTRVPQDGGSFQEPHECRSCERQGPFRLNEDQSEFVDAQRLRVQESPEGLRGGETPQAIDVNVEDDVTGEVTPGDHVGVTGVLRLDQEEGRESPIFDVYMEGVSVEVEEEQFEDMDITDADTEQILELADREDVYERMVDAIAPSIHGYEEEKLAMTFQLFSGVTKHLPDESRIRGDLHILLIGDPGTGKCVHGDTGVTLGDGTETPIRDLVESNLDDPVPVDDGVYDTIDFEVPSMTADGRMTTGRATKVWKREAPDRLYRVRTASGRELEVTPSHPLFVASDGQPLARKAKNLSAGDFVAVPPSSPAAGSGRAGVLADGGTAVAGRNRSGRDQVGTDIVWERIGSIEPIEHDEDWVYDLEVEGTHSYVSEGVISHNSQLLQYVRNIAPRSVYTSGKGSSSAGLCVTGDTVVHTADGFRRMRNVVSESLPEPVDDETASARAIDLQTFDRNEGAMVDATSSHVWRMPEKPCRRIETNHGKQLEASVNTPVLTCGDDGIEWTEISDVEPGNYVAMPKYGDLDREEVDVREFLELTTEKLRLTEETIEFLRTELTEEFGTLRDAAAELDLSEDFIYLHLKNRHVPLDKLDRMLGAIDASRADVGFERLMISHGQSVTIPEVFDEDLMYLLGLVFGDGDIALDRRDGNRGMVRISNGDERLLERATDVFESKFDKRLEIEHQDDRVPSIRVNSATIARLFSNAGMETPKTDLALHPRLTVAEHADAFLRGLMDADGSVSNRNDGGSSVLLSTISRDLAEQVQSMLETYDVRASVRERDRRGTYELDDGSTIESRHVQYFVELYGADIDRYAEAIGFEATEKQKALDEIVRDERRQREKLPLGSGLTLADGAGAGRYYQNVHRGDNPGRERAREMLKDLDLGAAEGHVREAVEADLRWDEITAVRDIGTREVFDLTVPGTNNFVGNGIVTHNTAAAVRDDFAEGNQWTLEAGALVLADQGIAAVDELDKMRCVRGDSLVHLGDGRVTKIRDLALEAAEDGSIEALPNGRTIRDLDLEAWTMDDAGTLVRRPVTAIHEYDAPETLTSVTLESGETIAATDDHPFFVLDGGERVQRAASDLSPGDWTYVPRQLPAEATDGGVAAPHVDQTVEPDRSEALGAVLGYLSGDGNVYYDRGEGVYGIRFTNSEEELLADFERACRAAFDAEPYRAESERREDGVETVRLSGKEYADAVLDAGMTLGRYDRKAFPDGVTERSSGAKAAFVRALADSEANVDTATGNVRITSASEELLRGTRSVLLAFGISCQLQHEPRANKRDVYQLAITDADSLRAFRRHVGFTLDRKRSALDTVCEAVDGDRTILDVVPDVGALLRECRESLRLHVSECGIVDSTYCNFEGGEANVSIHRARRILEAFETRRSEAREDLDALGDTCSWEALAACKRRYHVSQSELARETEYTQQQISRLWGEDERLRRTACRRLADVVEPVAQTDLSSLRSLVRSDVKWRRVDAVDSVPAARTDGRIEVLRNELADVVGTDAADAIDRGRCLLADDLDAATWSELDALLDRYDVSFQCLATELGVAGSTVSRWVNGVVETDRFGDAHSAALARIRRKRRRIEDLLVEIDRRRQPRVYDLTVEGTHNFVANGFVTHNSEDRSAMHEALEQQSISISKAGINATLKSRCSLLGAANPKYGRFDQYEPIGEQIDLEPALISRFDLIFTVTDQPDPEEDRELAEHILEANYAGQLNTQREQMTAPDVTRDQVEAAQETVEPSIEPELLRKYVAYAQQTCYPRMTDEAREAIQEFYVDLRSKGADEDAPVPVTARKLEALVRLAEASARVRLADEVTREDADRVIEIVRSCLQDIGVDPETGQFDADVVETGTSKSQRDRIKNIKALIDEMGEEYEEGVPVDALLDRADEVGIGAQKAERELEKLKQKGEVYEPRTDHVRTT